MTAKRVAPRKPKRSAGYAPRPPRPEERARARRILAKLERAYPDWGPTLEFDDPLQLLVATILAAQAQDERINQVTRDVVFRKYRTAHDYVKVKQSVLERDLVPTGFFRQKAKAVKAAALGIVERFDGVVPRDMDGLVSLHGVGRKTASIVLGAAYGVPAIAVDRHVARVASRPPDLPAHPEVPGVPGARALSLRAEDRQLRVASQPPAAPSPSRMTSRATVVAVSTTMPVSAEGGSEVVTIASATIQSAATTAPCNAPAPAATRPAR